MVFFNKKKRNLLVVQQYINATRICRLHKLTNREIDLVIRKIKVKPKIKKKHLRKLQ